MSSYVSMRTLPGSDDDVFLRPPLWEDITSSIQNIDPENANMLAVGGQVKLEVVDELVGCAPTPLLSPLEIKTEKVIQQQQQQQQQTGQIVTTPPTLHLMGTPTSPYNGAASPQQHQQQQPQPHYQQQQQQQPLLHQQYKYNGGAQVGPVPGNALYPPMTRLMYVSPLTPPSSEPGSPGGALPRRTPPPPYPAPGACVAQSPAQSSGPRLGSSMHKYNRRNNPELEKRRIHHCDFMG